MLEGGGMMEEGGQADVRLVTVLAAASLAVTAGLYARLYRPHRGSS